MRLLYVTWDGPESTYLESLFFPVFEQLAASGFRTHVLQFSWDTARFRDRVASAARRRNVTYEVHEVPRYPLRAATAMALTAGAFHIAAVSRRQKSDVIIPRSHIPAAMTLLARPALGRRPLVWDSDGLMPDERVDFGGWRATGATYRFFTAVERLIMSVSAATLTRTQAAGELLIARGARRETVHVVPNGKDTHEFRPAEPAERRERRMRLGIPQDAPLIVYAGSVGPQYLAPQMGTFFKAINTLVPAAHFLGLTGSPEMLRAALEHAQVPSSHVSVMRVAPDEVAGWLRVADLGLSLRTPTTSMCAVSPIKVAEYLLSGVPVIANAGVGDIESTLTDTNAGLVLRDTSAPSLTAAARHASSEFLSGKEAPRAAARKLGLAMFSIEIASAGYVQAIRAGLKA